MSTCNSIPISSCMYSCPSWMLQRELGQSSWILRDDFFVSQVTAPALEADASSNEDNTCVKDDPDEVSKPLREKNCRKPSRYLHVPHRDKPPQVVAKRNARERRRVQAVNSAFMRLRKAVPMENNRGKRISKVKTLQHAIEYIRRLQVLLQKEGAYQNMNVIPNYYYTTSSDSMDNLDFEEEF